jgi:hypothetical protein
MSANSPGLAGCLGSIWSALAILTIPFDAFPIAFLIVFFSFSLVPDLINCSGIIGWLGSASANEPVGSIILFASAIWSSAIVWSESIFLPAFLKPYLTE